MLYFKDSNNQLYALDNEDFIHLLPSGLTQITEEEYELISNPQLSQSYVLQKWRETTSVTPRQIRLALNDPQINMRQAVENIVATSNNQDIKDMWEFSLEYKRLDPILTQMAVQLGLTDEQIDNIFELALTK